MLTPAQAEALILSKVPLLEAETCPLGEAAGRVLREDLTADRDFPPYDRVTMDGFALRSTDLGLSSLKVEGMQAAGAPQRQIGPQGTVLEIATGAVLPLGADLVVPYEDCIREMDTLSVRPGVALKAGSNIHPRGADARKGQVLVHAGRRLGGREAAVAAACGYAAVNVSRKPRLAVVATGDELVEVGGPAPLAHQVRRSNDAALKAALLEANLAEVETFHLQDDKPRIQASIAALLGRFDALLLTGGISKGRYDHLPSVFEALGFQKFIHGVAQRPGKPFWFGLAGQVPVFALPGNPVSTFTCFRRYVVPALLKMSGLPQEVHRTIGLVNSYAFPAPLAPLLPARLEVDVAGRVRAQPAPTHTSGDFAGLIETDGFLELPPGPQTYVEDTPGTFWPWKVNS